MGQVDINPLASPARTTRSTVTLEPGQTCQAPRRPHHQLPTRKAMTLPPMSSTIGAWALASWSACCANLTEYHQFAPMSHVVAMMCDSCFIDHIREDCVIDGHISNCNINTVNVVQFSDVEGSKPRSLRTPAMEAGDSQSASTPAPTLMTRRPHKPSLSN